MVKRRVRGRGGRNAANRQTLRGSGVAAEVRRGRTGEGAQAIGGQERARMTGARTPRRTPSGLRIRNRSRTGGSLGRRQALGEGGGRKGGGGSGWLTRSVLPASSGTASRSLTQRDPLACALIARNTTICGRFGFFVDGRKVRCSTTELAAQHIEYKGLLHVAGSTAGNRPANPRGSMVPVVCSSRDAEVVPLSPAGFQVPTMRPS